MSRLRDAMPLTAEFIDALRAAFGAEAINTEIRKGIGGLPGHFYAKENGQEVGTPFPECYSVGGDDLGLPAARTKP